ncbi:MAG TPA: hypothetical protein VF552_05245 [Allosphingosinicella sp.]
MSILAWLALGAASLAGAAPDQPQSDRVQNPSPPVQRFTAAQFARTFGQHLPRDFGAGVLLTGVEAEGDVVILTIALVEAIPGAPRNEFMTPVLAGLCARGTTPMFENGVGVSLVTMMPGLPPHRSDVVRSCPAKSR